MAFVLLIAPLRSVAQTDPRTERPTASVTLTITDAQGARIGRALVLVVPERDFNSAPPRRQTNPSGQTSIVLADGFYYLFVAAPGFSAHCETLRVRDGKDRALEIVLNVDELMLRERGDDFTQSPPPVPLEPR